MPFESVVLALPAPSISSTVDLGRRCWAAFCIDSEPPPLKLLGILCRAMSDGSAPESFVGGEVVLTVRAEEVLSNFLAAGSEISFCSGLDCCEFLALSPCPREVSVLVFPFDEVFCG
jgi:hypothetical protein